MIRARLPALVPFGLVLLALWWQWPKLDHPAIASWDESMHQVATRGFHDNGVPSLFPDPLFPVKPDDWAHAPVFLHKPPLPFALGALMMGVLGPTPLALRSVSFAALLGAAMAMYFFGRRLLGWQLAATLAAGFLALPFGMTLVQGFQFGDVTDCTLVAFVVSSIWVLCLSLERDSARLAALAGALCGLGYLSKSALALVPAGVLCALAFLGKRGRAAPVRLSVLLAFAGATLAVAAPWSIYSALKWPMASTFETRHLLGFLTDTHRTFSRPVDGLIDQVNGAELAPWPSALILLAGVWLLRVAKQRPTLPLLMLCLWLWGEWIPLSIAAVKVPAHGWAAIPAALLALGILLLDALERPWLAGAVIGTFFTPLWFNATRMLVLSHTPVTRIEMAAARLNLIQGALLALVGAGAGWGLSRLVARRAWVTRSLGRIAVLAAVFMALVWSPLSVAAARQKRGDQLLDSYSDQIGPILGRVLPERSMLFYDMAKDPPCCFEQYSLMFYSGKMAYRYTAAGVERAKGRGYHPYLVSGLAQPYKRVDAVPATCWLQAFDLLAPLEVAEPPPPDMIHVDEKVQTLEVLGYAVGPGDETRDRYVFYLHASEFPRVAVSVGFIPEHGIPVTTPDAATGETQPTLDARHILEQPPDLAAVPWFSMTLTGPRRETLKEIWVGDQLMPMK